MQTSQQIIRLMQELGLDPNDRDQRAIVETLVASRPDAPLNEAFVSQLREQIMEELSKRSQINQSQNSNQSTNIFIFMKRTIVVAFVLVLALAAGGLWFMQQGSQPLLKITDRGNDTELLSGKYAVTEVSANSFGQLTTSNLSASGRGTNNAAMGSGGDLAQNQTTAESQQKMIAPGEPNPNIPGTGTDTSMPYQGEVYKFEYKGADLNALSATESVYKRIKPTQPASLVERIINTISLGLIDLSKFNNNAQLQSFTVNENQEYGYNINVAVDQGSVSIYQNWEKWPQPYNECRDESCFARYRIKESEMPTDEEAINIANNFLSQYSISRESYAVPQIQYDWRQLFERTPVADRFAFYFPEQVQVVYPLILDGKSVYDEGGNYHGLNVTIDVRTRKVSSIYELTTKQFEKSDYVGETSTKRILDVASKGGFRNYSYPSEGAKEITLQLGTPTREMVNMWYSKDNRGGEPLYVPALVFPITNSNSANYWRKNVIVPLVKEMLDSDNQPPVIMMDTKAGSAGSPISVPPATREPDAPVSTTPGQGQ